MLVHFRGRDPNVCRVCRLADNDDWLGCDKCGQFFHASCLGLNFSEALCEPFFYCPWINKCIIYAIFPLFRPRAGFLPVILDCGPVCGLIIYFGLYINFHVILKIIMVSVNSSRANPPGSSQLFLILAVELLANFLARGWGLRRFPSWQAITIGRFCWERY